MTETAVPAQAQNVRFLREIVKIGSHLESARALSAVNVVTSDGDAPDRLPFHIKRRPQIARDLHGVNGCAVDCGKLVCGRSRESNGLCLKILNAAAASRRSSGDNFARARRNDLAARKRYFTPANQAPPGPHPARSLRRVRFLACPA